MNFASSVRKKDAEIEKGLFNLVRCPKKRRAEMKYCQVTLGGCMQIQQSDGSIAGSSDP